MSTLVPASWPRIPRHILSLVKQNSIGGVLFGQYGRCRSLLAPDHHNLIAGLQLVRQKKTQTTLGRFFGKSETRGRARFSSDCLQIGHAWQHTSPVGQMRTHKIFGNPKGYDYFNAGHQDKGWVFVDMNSLVHALTSD